MCYGDSRLKLVINKIGCWLLHVLPLVAGDSNWEFSAEFCHLVWLLTNFKMWLFSFKFSLGSIIFQSSAFNNIVKVLKTFWPSSELPNPDHVENSYWLHNIFFVSDIYCGPYEKMLLKHLLYDYERQNRPVLNETEPLVLTFGITLQQIIDVVNIVSLHISYMMSAIGMN